MKAITTHAALSRWQTQTTLRASVILVLGVIAFGFSAIFARWADAPGLIVATWRVCVAAAVLAIPFARQVPEHRRLDRATLRRAAIGGSVFASSVAIFHIALDDTSAANVAFLGNIAPLWVGLITLFILHKTLPRLFWPGVAVALVGAALIVFGNNGLAGIQAGDLIVLGGSVIWAVYQVMTGQGRAHTSTLTWVWLILAVSVLWLVPASLALGYALGGYDLETTVAMLSSGLIPQAAGFMAFNYALGVLPAARVSVTNLLQPVVTALAAFVLLSEPFAGLRLIGGGLILTGVYMVNRPDAPSRQPPAPSRAFGR